MKYLLFMMFCLAMSCNSSQKATSEVKQEASTVDPAITFAETITEEELKEHLFIYASDEYEGRETGTPGQKKAVAYLKAEYERLEIPAAKSDGDYFQKVPLEMTKLPTGAISINEKEYGLGDAFVTFSTAKGDFSEVVYVGFGIEEDGHSDSKV